MRVLLQMLLAAAAAEDAPCELTAETVAPTCTCVDLCDDVTAGTLCRKVHDLLLWRTTSQAKLIGGDAYGPAVSHAVSCLRRATVRLALSGSCTSFQYVPRAPSRRPAPPLARRDT